MSRFGRSESLERLQRNMSRLHSALATSQELDGILVTVDDDEPKCNPCEMYREVDFPQYDDGGSIDSVEFRDIAWYMCKPNTFEAYSCLKWYSDEPDEEELPF